MPQDALTHAEQPGASRLPTDLAVAPMRQKTTMPLLSRTFASLDEAVQYAHGQAAFKGLKRPSSFILKQAQKAEFTVAQALDGAPMPFDPDALFGRDAQGRLRLPEGFILAGLYCQAETAHEQLPPRESWLYENFFSPYDLFAGLHHARRSRAPAPGAHPPPLFFGTPDGALLAYHPGDSELEQALLPEGADWQARARHAREQLLSGALPPHQFVRTIAAAGSLQVLHGSYLWNRQGRVDPIHWAPFTDAVLPELGPAFLSADDAARHAQQLIQGGSDKEFGGLIFQRQDATFVATLPTTGNDRRFNRNTLYPITETGIASFPPGHRLYAVYRSNISLSALKEQNDGPLDRPSILSEQETRLRLKSITPDEVLTTLLARPQGVRAFYALMTDSTIIKYMPSGSAEEDALIPRLLPGNDLSDLNRLLPSEFIKSLAKTGALYVVRGDTYWGPPGQVPRDWAPYPAQKASTPALPAFGPLFDSADAAALYANERINGHYRDRRIGVIISDSHQRYAASEPLSAREPLFAADPRLPTGADGSPALPPGCRLAGFYYSAALYPRRLPCKDVWIYRNFFLPAELLAALKQIKAYRPEPNSPTLPLYLSTRDGAQLKYRSLDIHADQALLAGSENLLSYGERLVKGILDPLNFIHALADSGELSVLQPSELWGPAGRVSSEWHAYHQLQRRVLGPLFASADDAARHAHGQIPRRYDKVYGGVILKRADGLFVASAPLVSATEIFDHTLVFPHRNGFPLEDHTIVGTYSSRLGNLDFLLAATEAQLYLNLFPTWDIYRAIKDRAIPLRYFSGQDGSLIRYTSQHSPSEIDLFKTLSPSPTDPLNLMENPTEQRFKSGLETDKGAVLTFARDLVKAGELRVLVPGRDIWTSPGKVLSIRDSAAGVLVETDQAAIANYSPVFSPVFMSAADAVRHALAQTNPRTQRSFGFIFKKTEKEYVSTAPALDISSDFDRTLILPPDIAVLSLIPGYRLDGLYVSEPRREAPPSDRVYQHFISVRDFAHAIKTARETAIVPGHQSTTRLYLASADGALFSYQVPLVPDADEVLRGSLFHNDGIDTQGQLENGSLSGRDYVRRVAASGKLSVLRPGTLWRQTGPVSASWDPSDGASGAIERYALSPLFAHPDDAARYTHGKIGQGRSALLADAIYRTSAPDGYVTLEPFVDGQAIKITRTLADRKTQALEQQRLELTLGKTPLDSIHYAKPLDPARYQTGDTPCADFFCVEDICFVTKTLLAENLFLNGIYYSSQDGALLKYEPRDSSAQRDLCIPVEPVSGNSITLPHVRLINAVASAGKLSVLETSPLWEKAGPISPTWNPPPASADRRPRATRELVPPLINSFNLGGIGATDVIDPQRPLPVVIAPLELKPRDRIDLYWGSHPDPVASHTQDSTPGASHLTLRVETRWIMSAEAVTVRYVLTPFPGGAPETAETQVRIKLDVPGDPDTQSATPTVNDKLELPVILPPGVIEDPEGVSVMIKRYANMAAGDAIVVSWHGRLVQHPPLLAPSDEVVVPIDPQIIREAGNSDAIIVRYEIRDGVNNWSRWSRPALVEVGIGDPDLRPPVVPRAQGMQLNLDTLNGADVQTLVLRYEGMSNAQTLRLLVERETALGATLPAYSAMLPGSDSDAFVSFEVPNEQFLLIIRGQARFYYYVETPNQPARRSRSLPLQITGRALTLKPPRVPVAEANGNVLDPMQTGVIARVEPYSFIAPGQSVTLIWLGTTATGMETRHQEAKVVIGTDQDIDFSIPDDQVSVLAGGSVVVRYEVQTVAPEPVVSQALLLPVSASPLDLPVPKVLEAHDTLLFPLQALMGATIRVGYVMETRDSIQAYWRGTPGAGTPLIDAKPGSAGGSVDFAVPVTAVSANIGKRVEVGYTVTRDGIPAPSEKLLLDVLPIAQDDLPTPFVHQAPDNQVLDLNTFSGDARIEILKWPHIQLGQRVWLRGEGTRSDGRPYSFAIWEAREIPSIADAFDDPVPRGELDQLKDLSGLTFTFKVTFDGSPDESTALTFPRLRLVVRTRQRVPELLFDTHPVSLPGKIYLIPCHPQVLPAFGPGTTSQRTASGGVPGYHYSSDNPRIAVVDGNGKVSVRGNGQTRIRVSDSAGQRKSYEVSVSGVVQCYNLGEGSKDETLHKARQKGLSIPSLDELISIRTAYGNRWPLQSPLKPKTWSSTSKSPLGLVHAVLDMTLDVVEPEHPYIKVTPGLSLLYEASGLGIGSALLLDCKKARGLPENARELERPRVEAALDDGQGLLPISALDAPVRVTFPVWSNPSTDETYQLLWGTELLGSPVFIGPGDNPGDTLNLDIPVEALTHGNHELRYRAYDTISQQWTDSFPTLIEVDREKPGQPLLAAMAFPPQVHDGLTSAQLSQLGNVLPGTIASYNGFAVGDQVSTFWGNIEGPGMRVMELKTIVIEFPRAFLLSLGADADWPVSYRIQDRAGNLSERSEAVTVKLRLSGSGRPDLVFDQRPVTLSGKIYLIPSHPTVLPAFGPSTSVRRQASGGTPGYTYSSGNPAIAVVDASGLVTVRGNGSTTITVRDQGGQMKSYNLTVSGVIHCHGLGLGTFANMQAKANAGHRRLPARAELKEIHRLYGNRWPLGAQREWLEENLRETESTTSRDFGLTWSTDRATVVPPIKYYVLHLPSGKESILFDLSNAYGLGLS
ncbi:Ig-like domain-containing protein [Pseudomonas sp. MWU12-2345]|uniref:Ig-like domain-containing protein n=1 Tax=Pseudomonas sp. MWU12-2345 TaxID=2928689 RepID=UPI00200EB98B|nr:Ig-like domain-containing protein [Pseudomonas sp. MWU12-2345]